MAKQGISTGTNPNDGTGDSLLTGAVKINGNFDELYTYLGNGSSLNYIGGRWANTSIGINTLSNVGVGTTNPTSALTVTGDGKVTGVVTATTFIGNVTGAVTGNVVGNVTGDVTGTASTAQGLTGTPTISVTDVSASGKVSAGGSVTGASVHGSTIHGSGNALTGIVTFINPGTNISLSGNQGYVTINATSATGYFEKNVTGINTSTFVGIGTTTATSALTVTGSGKFTGIVTATTFVGNVTGGVTGNVVGNVTGNVVGNVTGDVTGTATTATKATQLLGSRTIGGVVFDNTGDINLPGVNAAGNQNTTGTAAGLSGTPNITVGIATVGTALSFADDKEARFGNSGDLRIYHDPSNTFIADNGSGDFYIQGGNVKIRNVAGSANLAQFVQSGRVALFFNGNEKFETTNGGTVTTGISTAVSFYSNDTTGDGTDIGFAIKYNITANGSSDYRFAGPGILNTVNDPTLYLQRGFTYIFNNTTGAHPFRIQFTGTTTGVGTYVSGSQTGIQYFTVPHDAPANYEYQCTSHAGMKGSFIIPS